MCSMQNMFHTTDAVSNMQLGKVTSLERRNKNAVLLLYYYNLNQLTSLRCRNALKLNLLNVIAT